MSALDRLDRDTSEITGLPWWMTRTGHPQVQFAVDTVEDAAEAVLDRYDQGQAKKKKKPGVHRFATVVGIDGFETEGGLAREAMLLFAGEQNGTDDPSDDLPPGLIDRKRPEGGYNPADYAA